MKNTKLVMNLQLFNDGEEGGSEVITFASQSEYDSAVDKRIASALEKAEGRWQEKSAQAIEQAKSEAQRMAGLSAEQKEAENKKQRDEEIAKREADITRRELRAQSLEQLAEKSLPKELIETIVLNDADSCIKSIEAVEKAFRSAVEIGVNERLVASANPPGAGGSVGGVTKGEQGSRLAKQSATTKKVSDPYFKNN